MPTVPECQRRNVPSSLPVKFSQSLQLNSARHGRARQLSDFQGLSIKSNIRARSELLICCCGHGFANEVAVAAGESRGCAQRNGCYFGGLPQLLDQSRNCRIERRWFAVGFN